MLQVYAELFPELHSQGVTYCHWKSNSHLEAGLSGDTDLDLLVREGQKEEFKEVLIRHDFKRVISPPPKHYPGIEHYLGFDFGTGKIVHLHVYYRLILGQRYFKNYHLPIETFILNDLRLVKGVFVPSVEVELFLLLIRASMKLGLGDILKYLLGQSKMPFPKGLLEEFGWLLKGYEKHKFSNVLQKSGLPLSRVRLIAFVEGLEQGRLALTEILGIRRHIFKALCPFRRYPFFGAFKRASFIRLHSAAILKHFLQASKKRLDGHGKSIAFVGADGSGKSTLADDIGKWLSPKLEVQTFYFGIPKTLGLSFLNKIAEGLRLLSQPGDGKTSIPFLESIRNTLVSFKWVCVARKRLNIFYEFQKVAETGGVAIGDRYPLVDFWNMDVPMDGPRIRKEGGNGNRKWAEREEQLYSLFGSPTKVFVLKASIGELRKRRSNLNPTSHHMKVKAVNSIEESHRICAIDANRPYNEILIDLKRDIWELL